MARRTVPNATLPHGLFLPWLGIATGEKITASGVDANSLGVKCELFCGMIRDEGIQTLQ